MGILVALSVLLVGSALLIPLFEYFGIWVLLGVLCIILTCVLIGLFKPVRTNKSDIILNFKSFLKFYNISPDSYTLCEDYVKYKGRYIINFKNNFEKFRYIYWRKSCERSEVLKWQLKNEADFIKEVQKDIESYNKSATQDFKDQMEYCWK